MNFDKLFSWISFCPFCSSFQFSIVTWILHTKHRFDWRFWAFNKLLSKHMFILNCSYWRNSAQISMNPMIYCTRGKHTNHYTTDDVFEILSCRPCWGIMLSCWENLLFLFSSYSLLWFQMWNFSKCLFRVCIFTDV